ncbi:flagellar protein FlaG [Paenibacillus urinalis]|uniref:Flagellar protein FlaG n=1 Tax=Paenibacillus urinalis TaxID=521520 RepID=A0AAX3N0T7_9BACL|nr:flagellar protein FlaG [Paenibacillus urinalis]WDH82237.1 flagellar protein FlaG [Paenibacillus urinalis]
MNIQLSISAGSTTSAQKTVDYPNVVEQTSDQRSNTTKSSNSMTPGQEHLIQNIERAIKALEGPRTTLNISIHEKTRDIMVKVLNKETGELIREIPPEKTLDLVAKMMEIAGILVDKKI